MRGFFLILMSLAWLALMGTAYADNGLVQSGLSRALQKELAQRIADHLEAPSQVTQEGILSLLERESAARGRVAFRSQQSLKEAAQPSFKYAVASAIALVGGVTCTVGTVAACALGDLSPWQLAAGVLGGSYSFIGGMFGGLGSYLASDAARYRDWKRQMSQMEKDLKPFFSELSRRGWRLQDYQKQALSSGVFRLLTHPCSVSLGGVESLIVESPIPG